MAPYDTYNFVALFNSFYSYLIQKIMNKTKTAVIIGIILTVVAIVGFTLILTRKQTVENGQIKSYWKKPKTDPDPETKA